MDIKIVEIGLQVQCDFRCPYCISEKVDKWSNLTSLNVENLTTFISNHFDDEVLIALTGGEPLLWDGLKIFIASFPNNLFMISSNIKHIEKHEWIVNPTPELRDRVCFRIGWHPNVRTDDFLTKINIIKNAGYHYVVNYMVDSVDRNGLVYDRIKYLKDNDIVYEVSAEEDPEHQNNFMDGTTSTQFYMRNYVDNKYFLRINSNANVYPCYVGKPIGTIDDGIFDLTLKDKNKYCDWCTGLKGYTKILTQWDKFNFNNIFPKRCRFSSDHAYEVFNDLIPYLDNIDDEESLSIYRAYRAKI